MDKYTDSTIYYSENVDKALINLEKYGITIFPSLITEDECQEMIDGMWNFLEYITSEGEYPIKKYDKTSWKNIQYLYPHNSMLIQHYSIGHAQFIWNLRQNPKIIDIFSQIYDTKPEELLVSFDGASFSIPPEIVGFGYAEQGKDIGLHTDQSFSKEGFQCIQSWIGGYETNKGDATIAFLESSHKYHEEFGNLYNIESISDWYRFTSEQLSFFSNKGCSEVRITCPKGSLVMWDSRLAHAGVSCLEEREKPNFRCVVYLCYQPREFVDSNIDLKSKRRAFRNMRTTSHWPCQTWLFPKLPNTYGNPEPKIKQIEPPILTDLGKKLAGF